jgi:hypothetical protein
MRKLPFYPLNLDCRHQIELTEISDKDDIEAQRTMMQLFLRFKCTKSLAINYHHHKWYQIIIHFTLYSLYLAID